MTKIVIASNWGWEPFNPTFHLTSHVCILTRTHGVHIKQKSCIYMCKHTHKQTPDTGVAVCIITPAPLLPSHSIWDKSITRWREEARDTHSWERVDVRWMCVAAKTLRTWPWPCLIIIIWAINTGCVMKTVAIRWKPYNSTVSTLRNSFVFSLTAVCFWGNPNVFWQGLT